MSVKSLVVVTGATGYLGSEQVTQLLEAGHRVRGTVRIGKEKKFLDSYPLHKGQLEVATVDDIAIDDLVPVFQGAYAVFHGAAPLPGPIADNILNAHVNGTLNALRAAVTANVKRFILTSSVAAIDRSPFERAWTDYTYTQEDWSDVTTEEILKPGVSPLLVYAGSKTLAEKAAWDFVARHPEISLTTITPPWIIGKMPKSFKPASPAVISTNRFVYQLISGEAGRPLPDHILPLYADLQDTVLVHIRAMEDARSIGQRILISCGGFTFKQAVEHIATTRPELKSRLPDMTTEKPLPGQHIGRMDCSLARDLLKPAPLKGWKESLIMAVDSLLEAEKKYHW